MKGAKPRSGERIVVNGLSCRNNPEGMKYNGYRKKQHEL